MFTIENTLLVIVDVQGKLANMMHEKEQLFENLQRIIKGVQVLDLPILWLEQYPQGLGPSIPEIVDLLSGQVPIEKTCFSGYMNENFVEALKATGRNDVLLVGIETHVCIYQTAIDLLSQGYGVEVVVDAVSSRTAENKEIGLQKMQDAGAGLTCVEMALFELLQVAEGEKFKAINRIVK